MPLAEAFNILLDAMRQAIPPSRPRPTAGTKVKLSILICHLAGRGPQLARLRAVLDPQVCDAVEILVETDNGEMPVGKKRNILLDRAQGDYICFIDDDDMVPDYYVAEILAAIVPDKDGNTPDVVGIVGHYFHGDRPPQKFVHSVRYSDWHIERSGQMNRTPNHLNPLRRSLALKAGFPEIDHGEDFEYSQRVSKLLNEDPEFSKTEVFIDKVMYEYRK
jgi:hypothetical protein